MNTINIYFFIYYFSHFSTFAFCFCYLVILFTCYLVILFTYQLLKPIDNKLHQIIYSAKSHLNLLLLNKIASPFLARCLIIKFRYLNQAISFSLRLEVRVYVKKLSLLYLVNYVSYYYFSFIQKIFIALSRSVDFLENRVLSILKHLLKSILLL